MENLVRGLFASVEPNSRGEVAGIKIVEQLVYLGLASDPSVLINILCSAFRASHISSLYLSLNDILQFTTGDRKTDTILSILNSSVPKKQTPTMADHLKMVNNWWKIMEKNHGNAVPVSAVTSELIDKGIASNTFEAYKIIGSSESKSIGALQFRQIFARAMLKGAFLGLSERLSHGPLSHPYLTSAMKLSAYKRKLVISKIRPTASITKAEGENAIKAIERYKNIVKAMKITN